MSNPKIGDWQQADETLAELAQARRDLGVLAAWRDKAIQRARDEFVTRGTPLEERIERLERALQHFVLEHQEELDGRSRKLAHGRCGFLLVRALHVRNVKRAVAWLLEAKKLAYLRVKHELNREALFDAPEEIKKAIGAKVRPSDEFWYEVDEQRYAVED